VPRYELSSPLSANETRGNYGLAALQSCWRLVIPIGSPPNSGRHGSQEMDRRGSRDSLHLNRSAN
jgi:hypothetical protein